MLSQSKFWQLPGDVWVVRRSPYAVLDDADDGFPSIDSDLLELNPGLTSYESDPLFARANLDRWIRDSVTRRAVIEMYQSVLAAPLTHDWSTVTTDEVSLKIKPRLERAFWKRELLVIYPVLEAGSSAEVEEEEELVKATAAVGQTLRPQTDRVKEKTWIQIELIDDKGKPVPNEPYRIELTDGSVQTGQLDDEGKARHEGIDPGTCKVTFPNIDAKEWKAA